jgi:hypothetical protein
MRRGLPYLLSALPAALAAADGPTLLCAREKDAPPAPVGLVAACVPDGVFARGVTARAEPSGQAVGARLFWAAPGEPTLILIDTSSGAAGYRVAPADAPSGWEPRAGVAVECRRRVDGPADTWEQARALWDKCGAVDGRALVDNVFQGIDVCGETRDFGADYHGWFQVARGGDYRFATNSDDASFVAVDGKLVASYGGGHGPDARHGEKGGVVRLEPGLHEVEYLYFQFGDNPIIELAWQPPGAAHPEIMPPAAFLPIARWRVESIDWPGAKPWFSWEMSGTCRAGGEALCEVALHAHVDKGAKPKWTFDDGGTAEGVDVIHGFARGGMRTVRMDAAGEACERAIAVHPLWTQVEEWNENLGRRIRDELQKRKPQSMPASDVLAQLRFADYVGDGHWVGIIGKGVLADPKHWGADGAPLLAQLGFALQDSDVREYEQAAAVWRALLQVAPGHSQLRDHSALHLGGLLVHGLDLADEAQQALAQVDPKQLDDGERRLLTLYLGDAALAKGDLNGARARYAEAGDVVKPGDLGYAVRRRTRLEAAKDWCARGEWDQALQSMREIEWETPSERLGTETGLLKVRAYLGRKELPFALACCRHMLVAAGPDEHRADVLYALVQVCVAAKQRDQAVEAARALIKDHPYSEAAAKVKDLIPEVGK